MRIWMKMILAALLVLTLCMTSFGFAEGIGFDYDSLSLEQLEQIIDDANDAIDRNHRVSGSDSSYLESKTKTLFVKLMPGLDKEPSWRWFDWTYSREWHSVTVKTEVKVDGDWLPLEARYSDESGDYELVYMKVNDEFLQGGNAAGSGKSNQSDAATDTAGEQQKEAIVAKMGDKNDIVKSIQDMLIQIGYMSGKSDGKYGDKTRIAVKVFQRDFGLEETGVVTESTYVALQNQHLSQAVATPTPKPVEEKVISISAIKLQDEYTENEIAADQKYKDKTIEVSGKVGSVDKSWGTIYVDLDSDEFGFWSIHCALKKDQEDSAAALKKGQTIVLRGKCEGYSLMIVSLRDCEIIK